MAEKYSLNLTVTDKYEIGEFLSADGVIRILLSPSQCYLNDDEIQLEAIIDELVNRYKDYFPKNSLIENLMSIRNGLVKIQSMVNDDSDEWQCAQDNRLQLESLIKTFNNNIL